jgi:predicted secreted protein
MGAVGRTSFLYWGNESPQPLVAGIRELGFNINGEAVDETNNDSDGWRTLLDAAGVNGVDIPIAGVLQNDTLLADAINGAAIGAGLRMQAASLVRWNGSMLTGTWYLQGYSETGAHDGEITFQATLMSSGPIVYTPAA